MKPQFAKSQVMAVLISFFLFKIKIHLNLGARKVWCCRKYVSCNKYAKVNEDEIAGTVLYGQIPNMLIVFPICLFGHAQKCEKLPFDSQGGKTITYLQSMFYVRMYLIRPFYGKESQSIFILEDPHRINFNYQQGRGILLKPFYTLYIPTYPSNIHFLIYISLYCYRWRCWHHFIHISLTLWSGKTQAVLLFRRKKASADLL